MFCTYCGTKSEGAHNFCTNCGAQTESEAAVAAVQAKRRAPGSRFLLITGILYIVFFTISALVWAIMLASPDDWLPEFGGEAMRDAWSIYYTICLIHAMFLVFVGIMGLVLRANRKRANILLTLGVADLLILVLNAIVAGVLGIYYYNAGFVFLPFHLVLPILFIVGAVKNRVREEEMSYV